MKEGYSDLFLILPRTGLRLQDGFLVKLKNGEKLGQFSMAHVQEISLVSTVEPLGLVCGAVTFGAALACKMYVASDLWSWLLALLLGGVFVVCLLLAKKQQMLFVTTFGEARYDVNDLPDEAEGFVVSLREYKDALQSRDEKEVPTAATGPGPLP